MVVWSRISVFIGLSLAVPLAIAAACLSDPVNISPNLVTSVFGKVRDLPQYQGVSRPHWGTDFQARNPSNPAQGADVIAVDSGTVIGAGYWGSGYGNRVALKRDNGDIVLYNHLASVDPSLKSGGAIGFSGGSGAVGTITVASGAKLGVAGGTSGHMNSNDLPIHLHLEYVTGYGGEKIRETNDGTNATRSHYMRDPLLYMCKSVAHAPGAGPVASGEGSGGGSVPSNGASSNQYSATSDEQIATAKGMQPSVGPGERYGVPDSPPYETYEGMSESQIVEAEMLRRTLDTDWELKLTSWNKRGLWVEIARIRGIKLWLQEQIATKRKRIEGLVATNYAFQTNEYFNPRMEAAYSRAMTASGIKKTK
jgi:hypothetical protein